jgi:hypothetical protein
MSNKNEIRDMIRDELRPICLKLDSLEKKLGDLTQSVKFISAKYDQLIEKQQKTDKKVSDVISSNAEIKRELLSTDQKADDSLKEIEEISQYLRRDCLEITGVNASDEEASVDAVKAISELLEIPPVTDADISIAHPLPTYSNGPPKIIVKFTRRSVRNKFYANRKKLYGVETKDLPTSRQELKTGSKIYIGESLTPKKRKLFGEVNRYRKDMKWRYIWTNNSKIFLKEGEQTVKHSIETKEDLIKLQSSNEAIARRTRQRHTQSQGT